MKRSFLLLVGGVLILVAGLVWWFKFEPGPPMAEFDQQRDVVGRHATWDFVIRAAGRPGLRRVEVRLEIEGKAYQVFHEEYPRAGWISSPNVEQPVHVEADLSVLGVSEGAAQLRVFADTYAWHLIPPRRGPVAERMITVDLIPPQVQLLTTQHNLRLGGSSVALFRVTSGTAQAGVAVNDYFFPATLGYFADQNVAVSIFAVPQDLSANAQPLVRVADEVGNTRDLALPCRIRGRKFPQRTLTIGDGFLQRKMPEIFAANGLPLPEDLVDAYLYVNGDLRRQSERQLLELTASSVGRPLWDGAFHRLSNSAPMSAFADRRSYVYAGDTIDQQTHLGYDLASLQRATVEAAQNGVVVFAGNLGIYGNTVVLDHGLGVFSLYGHLSAFAVEVGQGVQTGQALGQTGETGLAGGDHLHFSVMLHGVHVDPVEWWDPRWMRDHVTAKLNMFPVATDDASDTVADAEANEGGSDGQARP